MTVSRFMLAYGKNVLKDYRSGRILRGQGPLRRKCGLVTLFEINVITMVPWEIFDK